jgi:hypothetical protein
MMDPKQFADRQIELATWFAQYTADHSEVDALLPEKSHLCFQMEGEAHFNRWSQGLAERLRQAEGNPIVRIWVKDLVERVEPR